MLVRVTHSSESSEKEGTAAERQRIHQITVKSVYSGHSIKQSATSSINTLHITDCTVNLAFSLVGMTRVPLYSVYTGDMYPFSTASLCPVASLNNTGAD